jgi:AraC-like DNA-binding protein
MNAASFQMALAVLNRYFFLSFPGIEFRLLNRNGPSEENEASVRLRPKFPLGDLAYFGTSSALVGCNGLFKGILRAQQVATRGELTVSEPGGWSQVAAHIGFPIHFNAHENRLIFSSAVLGQLLPGSDPINHRRLLKLCEKFALDADCEATLASRVLSLLETEGNFGAPLSKAAALLGYSPRSLRRELEETGTSYRILMEQVRESRARQLLAGSARSIQAIAYELGYEAPSNFSRSFKRWTGVSPKEYRDAQQGDLGNSHK